MISNYDVEHAPDTYRPVPGEIIVKFHRKTVVQKFEAETDIPRVKFELKAFQEARTRLGDVVNLMDVVGKLTEFTHVQTTSGGKKKLDIVLSLLIKAYNFLNLETKYKKPDVFVIVTGVSTKSVQGEIVLWSSSSTQSFFDIEHPALLTLRENPNMKDNKIPTLAPIINNPMQATIQFFVEATVVGLIPYYGWCYIACNKCNKKMNEVQECNSCEDRTRPIPRYKVMLAVQDSTANTSFVLFDRQVMKLINVSAQHILNNDQNASPDIIPPVLNNMLGKTYKFKVTLTSYNTVKKLEGYTVSDIEEVKSLESEKPKSDADAGTPKGQLDREIKEPSESPLDNKRKLLDLSPPDKTSKIDSGVALDDDTTDQANNGDQSPATPTGMKKKLAGRTTNVKNNNCY
ncbi:hypothetical protein POM88_016185 [Heracleum sosnowskyi]|uniref:Replication factor A C-terminal domain-containing protein n=1 Tax=Heracleum sosnowskyi TaxID=360622 RepID=A0AAD8MX42_9APIA|nr:hypothetical protein POM88_016185 [Heracleum sosnowskyi]